MQFLGRALRLGQAREPSCHAKLLRNPAYCTSLSMYSTNKYTNNDCETYFYIIQIASYQIVSYQTVGYQTVTCQVTKLSSYQIAKLPKCWLPNCRVTKESGYQIVSYQIICYQIVSDQNVSYQIISYRNPPVNRMASRLVDRKEEK